MREAAREARARRWRVLGDLQGPKIRVGALAEPVELHPGDVVTFAPEGEHGPGRAPHHLPASSPQDVEEGDVVLLADGLMELHRGGRRAAAREDARASTAARSPRNKGINLPGVRMSVPSLTEKDLRDLEFALEQEVDYIALSFVRAAEDVHRPARGASPPAARSWW